MDYNHKNSDFIHFMQNWKLSIEQKCQLQPFAFEFQFSQHTDIWLLQCNLFNCDLQSLRLKSICWKGYSQLLPLFFTVQEDIRKIILFLIGKLLLTRSWRCVRRHRYTRLSISCNGSKFCEWRSVSRKWVEAGSFGRKNYRI